MHLKYEYDDTKYKLSENFLGMTDLIEKEENEAIKLNALGVLYDIQKFILLDTFDLTISRTLFRDEYDGYAYMSAVEERTNRVNTGINYRRTTMKADCYNVMCEAYQILYTKLMFQIIKEILG
ncbi:hypothetical protein CEXT_247211 [Caerostris extrusa]|uniref:Uncharacterized protein n=1 Tax=Caerostris extrusa TaxID=172846 RepID=A0AAV4WX92_CAEEX|nr:hypothetical protein CEXT_247211 [Caerostris extrusa]